MAWKKPRIAIPVIVQTSLPDGSPMLLPWAEHLDLSEEVSAELRALALSSIEDVALAFERDPIVKPTMKRKLVGEIRESLVWFRRVHEIPAPLSRPLIVSTEGEPKDLAGLVDRMLTDLPEHRKRLADLVFFQRLSIVRASRILERPKQTLDYQFHRIAEDCRERWGEACGRLAGPLHVALFKANGLLHRVDVERLASGCDLDRARFAIFVLGEPNVAVFRQEFLYIPGLAEPAILIEQVQKAFFHRRNEFVSPRVIASDRLAEMGRSLSPPALQAILRYLSVSEERQEQSAAGSPGARMLDILRKAGHPLSKAELVERLSATSLMEGADGERKFAVSTIEQTAARSSEVFRVQASCFVHRDHLALSPRQLKETVERARVCMSGQAGPRSLAWLLEQMKREAPLPDCLNEVLLKDILRRDKRFVALHGSFVAYKATNKEAGMDLEARVHEILLHADRPLNLSEIYAQLISNGMSYSRMSLHAFLRYDRVLLFLGRSTWAHPRRTGLTAQEHLAIIERAKALLPLSGSPLPTSELLRQIEPAQRIGDLFAGPAQEQGLWGILHTDRDLVCQLKNLVSRAVGTHPGSATSRGIVEWMRDQGVASRAEIREQCRVMYGKEILSRQVAMALQVALRDGHLGLLVPGLYASISILDARMMCLLERRNGEINSALGKALFEEWSPWGMGVIARHLEARGETESARRLLDAMESASSPAPQPALR